MEPDTVLGEVQVSAVAPPPTMTALGSLWDGLSPHLIASIYEVTKGKDGTWAALPDNIIVRAPLTEASMEVVLNWQSPFEQSGPESRAPTLLAMLQSGSLQPVIESMVGKEKERGADTGISAMLNRTDSFLSGFAGRTGITKLNSTQVFSGMPPVKIQVTALFRAWRNPASEVEAPFDQLMQWALPEKLSPDGSVLARAAKWLRGEMDTIEAVMPSKSPTQVALKYKGRVYSPLVIESIGQPMDSPVDRNGRYTELLVPMTLCTLTALDRQDWVNTRTSAL